MNLMASPILDSFEYLNLDEFLVNRQISHDVQVHFAAKCDIFPHQFQSHLDLSLNEPKIMIH